MVELYVLGMAITGILLLSVTVISRDELGEYSDRELLSLTIFFTSLILLSWVGLGFLALFGTLHNLLGEK